VFLQMTQNTFLAVVILNVPTVLYAHYATLVRPWGPSGIDDQRLAAGIMWLGGDLIFLTAIMVLVAGWMRAEGRETARADREAAVDLAQIHVREQRLAEHLANERGESRG
jgi:cytochrome c oxidase assembly factor CtaG